MKSNRQFTANYCQRKTNIFDEILRYTKNRVFCILGATIKLLTNLSYYDILMYTFNIESYANL